MRTLYLVPALALAAACASNTGEPLPAPVVSAPPVNEDGSADDYALAMETVETLVDSGNEQKAIDRLTQLLGKPSLTYVQEVNALFRRAELRYGAGNDVEGAVDDYDEIISLLNSDAEREETAEQAAIARMEMDMLRAALLEPDLQPTDEFEILFRLGRHQDAADLMLARNLTPRDMFLVDMYQIGYLCDDPTLTGPAYDMPGPDGDRLTVHFCDFGK